MRRVAFVNLPDISVRQLEYLVAVDESPTWSVAARRVGVSASALSQGLAELERRVGVDLFDRVGRRRVLRPSAQPVLDHARRVVSLTGDLMRWSERIRGAALGRVALGMIDVAAVTHFPAVIRKFRRDRPDVDVRLTVAPSAELLGRLRSGAVDLAVCVAPPAPVDAIATVPLFDEPLWVLAPADTVIGEPGTWGPWVTFPPNSHTRHEIERALGEAGSPVTVVADSHQPEVLTEMVRMGLGWTVLPIDPTDPPTGVVVGQQMLTRTLVIARRDGSVVDPSADALADRLMDAT